MFSPLKVAVDYADRIYVIAQNQFEGIMAFDAEGNFTGFTGTINVQITTAEIIWRKLSTKAQRAKQQLFIPTEFTGMEIDSDGFVYATNVDAEGEQSVRRLNPSGEDVIQKGAAGVSGDILWRLTGDYSGASRIIDVVVRRKESIRSSTPRGEGSLPTIMKGIFSISLVVSEVRRVPLIRRPRSIRSGMRSLYWTVPKILWINTGQPITVS